MKTFFESPRRVGFSLAFLAACVSALAMTRAPETVTPGRFAGEEFAEAQRALATKPAEDPAPTF